MSEHIVPRPELTAEYLRSVLHYEPATGIFTWKISNSNRVKVGEVTGSPDGGGYLRIQLQSRLYKAHRLAWLYVYGEWPKLNIDHINRNPSDNQLVNLRNVTQKQNGQNASKPSSNTSGHTGVSWKKQNSKWVAHIRHNHKLIHLGCFATIEDAVAARKAGELKYWGHHRAD